MTAPVPARGGLTPQGERPRLPRGGTPADILDPSDVLRSLGTDDPAELVRAGVEAARSGDFERGLIFLAEGYLRYSRTPEARMPPAALSWYGLCLASHRSRFREGADFCQLAIDREFHNPEHYANLARVWAAGKSRRKAVEAMQRGLAIDPDDQVLRKLRESFGLRRAPVLPFLHRNHPLNQALGRLRHRFRGPAAKVPKE